MTTMSFDGVSYVTVSSNDENYNIGKYEMQFRFRTTLSNVLVAVGQGKHFISSFAQINGCTITLSCV